MPMSDLFLLDPPVAPAWAPFQTARPLAECRAGAWLIRERWEAVADAAATAILGPVHLHAFTEDGAPPVRAAGPVTGPALIGRSDFAPTGVAPDLPRGAARLVNDGETVGWWVPAGGSWAGPDAAGEDVELEGLLLHGTFDLLTALEQLLAGDVADFLREGGEPIPDASIVIGDPRDVVVLGARVEPGVVFDVRHGAVVLEQHAYVRSGSRLEGPLYVGPGSEILGGVVGTSAIGPRCKVRGEVTATAFFGYANKGHDGFLGHSVVGRWVNLGAGTTTSNLKNTYGAVRLDLDGARIETGRQFLGSLVGDHAKTAIGSLLPTGAVVGVGANVFGAANVPKAVPAFAWGFGGERQSLNGFLTTARRTMPRRSVEVTDAVTAALEAAYRFGASA
jgi:UDP-N-acetylglucosamine diphosphorylase / glucose-1-phosphate thymidylyltransferase / UDP-N-acetylgalactosamine diphosphorylase / glucosamine-1-phosphate N-acetyltransferase / galactosamine-1-phosphate N-acetyltransferase